MRLIAIGFLLLSTVQAFGQGLNYSAPRQTVRLEAGMTVFSDINNSLGGYANVAYEYAFLEHVAAEAYLNTSIRQSANYVGSHASRYGGGINLIGRLYGIKHPFDVKVYGGARYGSHFSTLLEDNAGTIVAVEGVRRHGFSPVFGVGYEHRVADWLITLDFNTSIETDLKSFASLAIGTGYRF